jgi:AcrR family transcriptional regulator
MARTLARDHDENRALILAGAARVFAREGFDRASMSRLATECGISKANIYHYYDSKDALLFDLLDTHLSSLRDRIAAVDGQGMDARAHLAAVVEELLLAYKGADDAHRVQIAAIGVLPETDQQVLRAYQRDLVGQVSAILARLAPDTLGADARRRRAAAMSLFGMLNWFYMWNRDDTDAARRDYADVVTRLMLGGVGAL